MNIREEFDQDIEAIGELTYKAFLNHPHHAPGAQPTEHKIIVELRKAGALKLSLVAMERGVILGHVAFSPVTINGKNLGWYGLGPVSVTPERQKQGIGKALINEGLRRLRDRGANGVALVGDPEYYAKFGFAPNPALTLEGVPPEYFVCLAFTAEAPQGAVEFHPAFLVK